MSGYNSRSMDGPASQVSSGTSFGAATLGAKLIPLQGKPSFVLGVNVPSFGGQVGREFGKNALLPDSEVSYNAKQVNTNLHDISSSGFNVVRLRLFSKLDGLKVDAAGLVTGVDEALYKNVSDLLSKAENSKVQIYVCLSGPWSGTAGVKNPLMDVAARTAYLKKAVTPLIGKLKGRPSVFAVSISDGIETEIAGKDGNSTKVGATWDQARDFVKANLDIIKSVDPQRLISCGSALHGWQNVKAGKLSRLGLDFYDFQVLDDKGILPPFKEIKVDRPALIGSCGQDSKKSDNAVQSKAIMTLLGNAEKLGYAGAILSEYSKDADNPLGLLDKDGKHRPVFADLQSFSATLAMNATTAPIAGQPKL